MASWIQDPVTGKLVPRETYVRPSARSHLVMEDIKPFVSPIDGKIISSRPQLNAHNREHGVTNTADYSPQFLKGKTDERVRAQQQEGHRDRIEVLKHFIK